MPYIIVWFENCNFSWYANSWSFNKFHSFIWFDSTKIEMPLNRCWIYDKNPTHLAHAFFCLSERLLWERWTSRSQKRVSQMWRFLSYSQHCRNFSESWHYQMILKFIMMVPHAILNKTNRDKIQKCYDSGTSI